MGRRDRSQKKYNQFQDHTVSVLNSPGIVPAELWLRCQAKLARNRQVGNAGKGKHTWLSGLLKCERCGYSMKVVEDKPYRYLACSGRYNLSHCDAVTHVKLDELEACVQEELVRLLEECPREEAPTAEKDADALRLEELDRRADRLVDAFAESEDMDSGYLQRALRRLEGERKAILDHQKRERSRPDLPDKLDFPALTFEEKKLVAAQFIEKINVGEDAAEVIWRV